MPNFFGFIGLPFLLGFLPPIVGAVFFNDLFRLAIIIGLLGVWLLPPVGPARRKLFARLAWQETAAAFLTMLGAWALGAICSTAILTGFF